MAKARTARKAAKRPVRNAQGTARSRTARKAAARHRTAARGTHKPKPAPKRQTFVASHLDPDSFAEGLRSYARYRDLGIAAATNGLARAHVIRMIPPCEPEVVSKRHYHEVDFQMIYVLKGWIRGAYEGAGEVVMREGSCWLQPPKIKHSVLDYSDDCELLEIILPADFKTVELE
jgi:uncharacterized RmlC-like cupin family protein